MDKQKLLTNIKLGIIISCLLLFSGSTKPENKGYDFIHWNIEKPLEWKNFEAKSSIVPGVSALTASALQTSYNCKGNDALEYMIHAVFMPEKSWVKKGDKSDFLLKHEQIHFDITEIYARKFRKMLSERKLKCSQRKEFDKLLETINKDWLEYQKLYDKETRHSINETAQEMWNERIDKELADLERFSL